MAKVLLFVVEDMAGPGIRALGAFLKQAGHQPILVFIERSAFLWSASFPEDYKLDSEYHATLTGFKKFAFGRPTPSFQELPDSFLTFCHIEQPDIIGFSTRFMESRFSSFFDSLRKTLPKSLIIAGGHGPSVYPEKFLDMGCDCVVRGEGEEPLLELANAIDSGKSYNNICNLSYKKDETIVNNTIREPIKNINALPLPLRQTSDIYHIDNNTLYYGDYKHGTNAFYNMILAGRGCIGSCSYCAAPLWRDIYTAQGIHAPKHRRRSNEHIIEEALLMKKNGATSILFMDDYFIRPYSEMVEFFQQWTEKINLPFFIHFSVEQLKKHPDLLQKAFDAGLTLLDLAIQSGDEQFCSEIFNRKNDNKAILQFMYEAYENYIPIFTEFIDGYLIDGRDDLESKLNFIRELPPFDPGYRYANSISVLQLSIHQGSPLSKRYPDSKKVMLSPSEFIYRSMLMHFRLVMDDKEFENFRKKERPRRNPEKLLGLFNTLIGARHNKYIEEMSENLMGKEVFFFGCGDIYHARKHLFANTKPRAILVDIPVEEHIVDGLEVLQLKDALTTDERLPIVIFSQWSLYVAQKIKKLRPDYTRSEIISCETIN